MADKLVILPRPIQQPNAIPAKGTKQKSTASISFKQFLSEQLRSVGQVQFSKHATQRMENRGIDFNAEELARLNRAVDRVQAKGANDSLVLLGETALIVSVKKNMVVTVVDKNNLNNNVFTNIDSAIIA